MKKSLFTLSTAFPLPSTHFVPLFELAAATSPLKNFTLFSFKKKQPWPKLQPLKPFQAMAAFHPPQHHGSRGQGCCFHSTGNPNFNSSPNSSNLGQILLQDPVA
ncbi:retrotransposon protein [Cucumis melo var. makuwa]|uniref:Retrotransposon protein n=1 Tax=Cucumis melo var. makuwa TaxID=1194695 RepID=A0A5A7UHI4_CUCMM|nr:retrotransposon protein [Cucumis melo var. makuwa]TYK20692.1 retrotransposon protein [Cucumis melo var. makuwa]